MKRKSKYEGILCASCGEIQASISGLCMRCYARELYRRKHFDKNGKKIVKPATKSIMDDLAAGMKPKDIAERHGCSRQWISQVKARMEKMEG